MTATSTDPRAARFAATLTSVVLAAVLVTPAPVAVVLLAWQTAVFAVGAGLGPTRTPYAALFRVALRPRLGPPSQTEGAAPQRFAQTVGLAFAGTGLVLTLLGAATAGLVAVGLALVAALLNAVVGLCLGCEMYLALQRLRPHAP